MGNIHSWQHRTHYQEYFTLTDLTVIFFVFPRDPARKKAKQKPFRQKSLKGLSLQLAEQVILFIVCI
jgi:hypothetical protein